MTSHPLQKTDRLKWLTGPGIYCILPLILTALSFSGLLNNILTNWDDDNYVVENALIRSLSWHSIRLIFSPSTLVIGNYQPLTILSLAVNYAMGGLNPVGYIATSLMLHLLNVVLVFVFIRKLAESDRIAGICALLFGIHPMHVEPVAWVSSRKDVLYTFFFLSSLLGYLRYCGSRGGKAAAAYGLTLVLTLLSLLSKSAAVTLPAILLLIDFYRKRKFTVALLLEKIPFLVPAVLLGILAIRGQQVSGSLGYDSACPAVGRLLIALYSYMFYVVKFIVPVKLSAYYPYPPPRLFSSWPVWYKLSLPGIAAVAAAAWYLRRSRIFVFGLLFFTISIIFIVHFVPVGATIVADRFSYVAYIGLSFIVAVGFDRLLSGGLMRGVSRAFVIAAGMLIIAVFCLAAHQRCKVWKDSFTLWTDVLEKAPSDPGSVYEAQEHFGMAFLKAGQPARAVDSLVKAVKYDSSFAYDHNVLGTAFWQLGRIAEAAAEYRKALRIDTGNFAAHENLAGMLLQLGRAEEAVPEWRRGLGKDSANTAVRLNLADALRQIGRTDEAAAEYRKVLTFDSSNIVARNNLAGMLRKLGRPEEAVAQYRRALELDPRCIEARLNLGRTLLKSGQGSDAETCFRKAVEVNSSDLDSLHRLCEVFMQIGQSRYAIIAANQAMALAKSTGQVELARAIAGNIEDMRRAESLKPAPGGR